MHFLPVFIYIFPMKFIRMGWNLKSSKSSCYKIYIITKNADKRLQLVCFSYLYVKSEFYLNYYFSDILLKIIHQLMFISLNNLCSMYISPKKAFSKYFLQFQNFTVTITFKIFHDILIWSFLLVIMFYILRLIIRQHLQQKFDVDFE